MKGRSFEGKTYEPLFPYFAHLKSEMGAFRVLCNTFVTTDQGTGIVHQAPYFGEVGESKQYAVLGRPVMIGDSSWNSKEHRKS